MTAATYGFINKLYEIFNNRDHSDYCGWGNLGESIVIRKVDAFSKDILPIYFKHSNFQSFVRQLNLYGFSKTAQDPSHSEFQQQHFKKGRPDLLEYIKRKANQKSSRKMIEFGDSNELVTVKKFDNCLIEESIDQNMKKRSNQFIDYYSNQSVTSSNQSNDSFSYQSSISSGQLIKNYSNQSNNYSNQFIDNYSNETICNSNQLITNYSDQSTIYYNTTNQENLQKLEQEAELIMSSINQQINFRNEYENRLESIESSNNSTDQLENEDSYLRRLVHESIKKEAIMQERIHNINGTSFMNEELYDDKIGLGFHLYEQNSFDSSLFQQVETNSLNSFNSMTSSNSDCIINRKSSNFNIFDNARNMIEYQSNQLITVGDTKIVQSSYSKWIESNHIESDDDSSDDDNNMNV